MKKFLMFTLLFTAVVSTTVLAQAPNDPAAMQKLMKERIRPQMVAKTGLTEAQADQVMDINYEIRQSAVGLRELNEADRTAKIAELKATKQRRYSEIPLTPEQVKAVNTFYEEMGRNREQRTGN